MPTPFRRAALLSGGLLLCSGALFSYFQQNKKPDIPPPDTTLPAIEKLATAPPTAKKIQVAILLDVSNSMDGLIEQAKAQLWNMVSLLGKSSCDGYAPPIEIALYEYGRSSNMPSKGYVEQITPFTNDLDEVSRQLFRLTTMGGDEYCGEVLVTSLSDLKWTAAKDDYKVVFIAGNEDFRQGRVSFTQACNLAKEKDVIVNTIYCGNRQQGINEHWNLGAECGKGSFSFINSNAEIDLIATPYDDKLHELNKPLNDTYVGYGNKGVESKVKQEEADNQNLALSIVVAAERMAVKSKKSLYKNTEWDLVDAQTADTAFYRKVDKQTLPPEMRTQSPQELKKSIDELAARRAALQKEIAEVQIKREQYILDERQKKAGKGENTLATEMEKLLREQAARKGIKVP